MKPDLAALRRGNGPPLIFGHRGYSSRAPENTLAAFELIRAHAIHGVELDVHRCASGEIVVAHDDTLERTAGVALRLTEASLEEIHEHDVGSWFAPEFAGERVPLLEDVFDLLGGHCFFDIEIKHYGVGAGRPQAASVEAETVNLIRRHGLADRCLVSSFNPFIVRRVRLLAPELPVAVIYANSTELPWILRRGGGRLLSGATIMKPNHEGTSRRMVARHHRAGRIVYPWTVDDEALARELADTGVDGVITNRPGEIRDAIAALEG